MRKHFGLDFIDYLVPKYFQDPYISLNDSFDSLLILLTLIATHQGSAKLQEFLTEERKQKLVSKLLDNYVRETQELNNEDKFFSLLMIFLRLFEDISLNFNDVMRHFLDPKKFQKSSHESKYPKFAKVSVLNLQLIQFYLLNARRDEIRFTEATK